MHVREKDISLYLDDSLAFNKRSRLESHFSVCPACRKKLQEYEKLYQTMNMLDFDFPLDGLELKVVNRIKEQKVLLSFRPVAEKAFSPGYVYAIILFVIAGLFYSPAGDAAGQMAQNTAAIMLNKGLDWINKVKWEIIDIFTGVLSAGLIVFLPLFYGIVLIAGGAYLFINKKEVKKI